jgi:hypothetical protein
MTIANTIHDAPVELARLLALVNTAMSDAGIASWVKLLSVLASDHGDS